MFDQDDHSALSEASGGAHRTRVKICGLTNLEDTALALELGADALGFNFYPRSSRYLGPDIDLGWIRELPAGVRRVAVVVNAESSMIRRLLDEQVVDSVQLHGDEEEDFCAGLRASGVRFAKAIRVRDALSLERSERFHTRDLLLDAYRPDAFGGTGHRVDWTLAADFVARQTALGKRVILSGGLTPGNVAEAVLRVRPYAVDVASGVEESGNPRRKNPALLREFFAAIRAADAETMVDSR